MHELLVNLLAKLAQEKNVVRLTDYLDMTIAVDWDKTTNQTNTVYKKVKHGQEIMVLIALCTHFFQNSRPLIVNSVDRDQLASSEASTVFHPHNESILKLYHLID